MSHLSTLVQLKSWSTNLDNNNRENYPFCFGLNVNQFNSKLKKSQGQHYKAVSNIEQNYFLKQCLGPQCIFNSEDQQIIKFLQI